ncbi:DUF1266 domain-containing protein [Kitasatospora sp. NPDC094011]|uniref:DUF1266 domain-containing protein n=1 Tax=Kitasatospora sp. NPDC094011 TaxID=3364090 RepID=UPI0037F130C7
MGIFGKIKKFFEYSFTIKEDAPPLTPGQERGLALGAIYAAEGHLPINALTAEADPVTAAKVVGGAWQATDTASARASYRYLLERGHRGIYQLVAPHVENLWSGVSGSRKELKAHYARATDELAAQAVQYGLDPAEVQHYATSWGRCTAALEKALPAPRAASIAAWDAARVVHVSRLFVDAGFIEPDEAWEAIGRAVELAEPRYSSWEGFTRGFLAGRAFWQAGQESYPDAEKISSSVGTFTFHADELLTREDSPWRRVAW